MNAGQSFSSLSVRVHKLPAASDTFQTIRIA